MITIKNMKWSLILVSVISLLAFVTIVTASPTTITEKMNPQEIQTIAVLSSEAAKAAPDSQPTIEQQAVPNPVDTSAPVSGSTAVPAKTPLQKPQLSRSIPASNTPAAPVKPSTQRTKASAIIATGKQYIGVDYVYGGTTPSGFDCSGFVQYVFAKNGISLPRVSRDQFKAGTSISFSSLQPGDLVFFSLAKNGVVDHEGIYVGNGQFINAASSKGVTIYTLGTYWKSAYVGAKRVL